MAMAATTRKFSSRYMLHRFFSSSRVMVGGSEAMKKVNYEDTRASLEQIKRTVELYQVQRRRMHENNAEDQLGKKFVNVGKLQLSDVEKTLSMNRTVDATENKQEGLKLMSGTADVEKWLESMCGIINDMEKRLEERLEPMHRTITAIDKKVEERLEAMTGTIDAMGRKLVEKLDFLHNKVEEVDPMRETNYGMDEKIDKSLERMSGTTNDMETRLANVEKEMEIFSQAIKAVEKNLADLEKELFEDGTEDEDGEEGVDDLVVQWLEPMSGNINAMEKKLANLEKGLERITWAINDMQKNLLDLQKKSVEGNEVVDPECVATHVAKAPCNGPSHKEMKENIEERVQEIRLLVKHFQEHTGSAIQSSIEARLREIELLLKHFTVDHDLQTKLKEEATDEQRHELNAALDKISNLKGVVTGLSIFSGCFAALLYLSRLR